MQKQPRLSFYHVPDAVLFYIISFNPYVNFMTSLIICVILLMKQLKFRGVAKCNKEEEP